VAGKQNEIQWLRAIAAIEVVLWHSDLITKHFSGHLLHEADWYRPFGGIGVDLFFIVSGYVICIRASSYRTAAAFMWARVTRIFPMYWIFTSLVILAVAINPAWRLHGHEITAWSILQSYLILPQRDYPILGVGWTLEHEMVFYALVAVLMALVGGLPQWSRVAFPFALAGMAIVGALIGAGPSGAVWDFHLLSPYLFAFAFGWLMCCVEKGDNAQRAWAFGVFITLAFMAFLLTDELGKGILTRIAIVSVVFVVFRLLSAVFATDNPVNRWASVLGDASFSLYLCHWFILSSLGKVFGALDLPESLEGVVRLFGIAICVAASVVIFMYLEKPIDKMLRGRATGERRVASVDRDAAWAAAAHQKPAPGQMKP